MLAGLVFCSFRNLFGNVASLVCTYTCTRSILWVTFTVLTPLFLLFFTYKCPLKVDYRSNVRIKMGDLCVFVPSDWSGEEGQENVFPSCLEAGCVWGCQQVKLSALERTRSAGVWPRMPSLAAAPRKVTFRQGKAPELSSLLSLFLFIRVASWRKSSARVLHQCRKFLTSLASWLIS